MKLVKITKKKTVPFKGTVYDLTVNKVHHYNIDGLIVHNSGAGSLVNYVLRITNVDPLQYNLYFERFLNKDRGHMPDIDSDFSPRRVSELYDHLNDLYGSDHCANVGTINFMQSKSVVKDVARVYGIPIDEANKITKYITEDIERPEQMLNVPELKTFFDKYPGLYTHIQKLYGAPRHTGQHPAGIIISPMPITDIIPVHNATPTASGRVHSLTAFDAGTCEELGGIKFDLLAIDGIDSLDFQMKILRSRYGMSGYLEDIPLDDEGAWNVICNGDTLGIWQMESPIGKSTIAKVQPRNIDELAAVNAFIRPGASGLESYVKGKRNAAELKKYHPLLDQYLVNTYGAIVFQEQTMALIAELTRVSFGKADIVRRAIEKPKKGNAPQIIDTFIKDAKRIGVEKGIPINVINDIIKVIIEAGGYGFNAAHAVCYAFIAYYGAYMKYHYPAAFYCAMMNMSAPGKLPHIFGEASKYKVYVTPPDVSKSNVDAIVDNDDSHIIHAGLGIIKGVGPAAIEKIIQNRPYETINELFVKYGDSKSTIDPLIAIGAMEKLPLDVNEEDLPDDIDFGNLQFTELDNNIYRIYMNRNQQQLWWNEYLVLKDKKIEQNYKIPLDQIQLKYIEMYEDPKKALGVGKDGMVICSPKQLSLLGFPKPNPTWKRTRSKTKGILAEEQAKKIPIMTQAFVNKLYEINNIVINPLNNYLMDLDRFDMSFSEHPFEYTISSGICSIVAEKHLEDRVSVIGIISSIKKGKTNSGADKMVVKIQTPRESVQLWLWVNEYNQLKKYIVKGRPIWVRAKRTFGEYIGSKPHDKNSLLICNPPTVQEVEQMVRNYQIRQQQQQTQTFLE